MSDAESGDQIELAGLRAERDSPCPVCGEAVGPAPTPCPVCETPHHFDCWEFSGGCGIYGCGARVRRRQPAPPVLPGKLGMPVRRAGAYAGHLWAPPVATVLVYVFEALAILLLFLEDPIGWFFLGGMVASLVWIGISSEHYYLDFDRQMVTKAKALFGHDVWEWDVEPLAELSHLALQEADLGEGAAPHLEVVAHYPDGRPPLPLSPPLAADSEACLAAADLLRRVQASQAFPARLPAALALPPGDASGEDPHATVDVSDPRTSP